MTPPHDQSQYQVRFDWGPEGASTVGSGVDVFIVVDVLPGAGAGSERRDIGQHLGSAAPGAAIIAGNLRNRTAIAEWVIARQADANRRIVVAIVAAGEDRGKGSIRFAVEDFLAAGAIIDALADVGIDYCSPEAAAACVSFTGLRPGIRHAVAASASGKELVESGFARELELASEVDSSTEVPVLAE